MTDFRAKVQDLEYTSPLKFCTSLVLRTEDPKDVISGDGYFLNCTQRIAPGDEIKICCIRDDATWDKAIFEVVVALQGNVVVQQITDWRHGGAQFIENLTAKHMGFGKWNVYDQSKKIVASGITKAEALTWVDDRKGEEAEAA